MKYYRPNFCWLTFLLHNISHNSSFVYIQVGLYSRPRSTQMFLAKTLCFIHSMFFQFLFLSAYYWLLSVLRFFFTFICFGPTLSIAGIEHVLCRWSPKQPRNSKSLLLGQHIDVTSSPKFYLLKASLLPNVFAFHWFCTHSLIVHRFSFWMTPIPLDTHVHSSIALRFFDLVVCVSARSCVRASVYLYEHTFSNLCIRVSTYQCLYVAVAVSICSFVARCYIPR